MTELDAIQRAMLDAVRQPLTATESMRRRTLDGRSLQKVAEKIIKPNDRLTSFERLEIYNRQYWFRVLSAFAEDFQGLQAILGERRFERLSTGYLLECPSQSFTLRNLGSRLHTWLASHREYIAGSEDIAMDMVRLEWAEIEVFDELSKPRLTEADLPDLGPDPTFELQPYLRLLALRYPVDELLIRVRRENQGIPDIVSNAVAERVHGRIRKRALPKSEQIYLAVHRVDHSVYFKRIDSEAFTILTELRKGKSLSDAVDAVDWSDRAPDEAMHAVQQWFAYWAAQGWFCKGGTQELSEAL